MIMKRKLTSEEKELIEKMKEMDNLKEKIRQAKETQQKKDEFNELMDKVADTNRKMHIEYRDILEDGFQLTYEDFLLMSIAKLQDNIDNRNYWDYVHSR